MISSPPSFSTHTLSRHIAAIDLGTNTIRLLIVRAESDSRLVAVHSDHVMTRLGEEVHQRRTLRDSAMDRTLRVLRRWRSLLVQHGITDPITVATSAVREAENQGEFVQRVRTAVGFEVQVLSGDEEARRTLVGIVAGLPCTLTDALIVDIGGGSTEYILARHGHPTRLCSTDLGVVRLTEGFLTSDPVRLDELKTAQRFIHGRLREVRRVLDDIGDATLVGTAGTVTTLAAMAQHLATYDPGKIHRYTLTLDAIRHIDHACVARTYAERRLLVGLEAGRADVIVAGTLILQLTMEDFGFSSLMVSEYGLREGILVDHIQQTTGKSVSLDLFWNAVSS